MSPDAEDAVLHSIHARLLAEDPTASADLCETFLPLLAGRLRRQFPTVDADQVHDAVVDALLNYIEHPQRYDPARGSLAHYLTLSARGDVLNLLRRETRRSQRLVPLEDGEDEVEVERRLRNSGVKTLEDLAVAAATSTQVNDLLQAVSRSDADQHVLDLMLDGERDTAVFAEALGLQHLTVVEQRHRVKQHKDRLIKRLQREWPRRGTHV